MEKNDLDKYIVELDATDEHGHPPGWYFHDEAGDLHGPYDGIENTRSELEVYVQWLQRHA